MGGRRAAADLTPAGDGRPVILDYPPSGDGSRQGPNAAQAEAHRIEVDELLYGGAAGGGKTDYLIAEVLAVLIEFPGSAGAIFRRTVPQLQELGGIANRLLDRLPQPEAGTYNAVQRVWTLRNGSMLRLAACARDADVTKYQGAEWAIVAFDQLEQFTEFQYRYMLHRLRQSGGVAAAMREVGYRPKAIASANPGGVGHGWVKRRWIDPFPRGRQPFRPAPTATEPDPSVRVFIPATLNDNEHNVDPGYRRQLEALPDDTRRAMLDGDWNVYAGQRFRQFTTGTHVVDPSRLRLPLSSAIPRALGIDYGLSAPFCALWGAKLADDLIYVYRELYRTELTPTQQAELILASEAPGERTRARPIPAALDPACWARGPDDPATVKGDVGAVTGPPPSSIAGKYVAAGVPVSKANNDRLAGVADIDDRLRVRADGFPRLLISSACTNLIRTLPELPRSTKRPEDIDTTAEDHAYDALRYLVLKLGRMRPGQSATAGVTPSAPPPGAPPRPGGRGAAAVLGRPVVEPIGEL
jgi:hypothetical protein